MYLSGFTIVITGFIKTVSGAGGSRTLVQTRKPYAFYMLIPVRIFVKQQEPDDQLLPYPLMIHCHIKAYNNYFRICCTAWLTASEKGLSGRWPVPSPCGGIKLTYYTSVRQRARSCFRQINWTRADIKEPAINALHAYAPPLHAVKSVSTPCKMLVLQELNCLILT